MASSVTSAVRCDLQPYGVTFSQRIRRQIGDLGELDLVEWSCLVLQVSHPQIMSHQGAASIHIKCHLRDFCPFADRVGLTKRQITSR